MNIISIIDGDSTFKVGIVLIFAAVVLWLILPLCDYENKDENHDWEDRK